MEPFLFPYVLYLLTGGEYKTAMTQEEYFKLIGKDIEPLMVSDSRFKGYVAYRSLVVFCLH